MDDRAYMKMALELAKKGSGFVNPNPMVGAVIVKNNKVIGRGYHQKYGGWHAEKNALADCAVSPEGATLYVTLEPCCHYGKTPPCTEAVIESGISRVVIGTPDKNPQMAGKGIKILQQHHIQVDVGVLEEECRALIKTFTKFITTGRPYVMMKYAMTMDGKTASRTNRSKWITGSKAREHVHAGRHQYSAVMVGVNTVIYDDPLLTCRLENGRNPVRIICDSRLRTPPDAQIVQTADTIKTIIATCSDDNVRQKLYTDKGCSIIRVTDTDRHVNLAELMDILGKMGIDSLLLEGGGSLNAGALSQRIVDGIQAYIAPKIFGGTEAKTPVGGLGIDMPEEALRLTNMSLQQFGGDYLLEGEVVYSCLQEL
jgi:diaminohydroxyphosphoribosylaminopyrimidine deaminase/5-amino-6-(5-phosphoribosylamino)uracil reductase